MKKVVKNAANIPTPAQVAKLQSGRLPGGRFYASKRGMATGTPAEQRLQSSLSAVLPKSNRG